MPFPYTYSFESVNASIKGPNGNFSTSWAGVGRANCLEISGLLGQLWWEYMNGINQKPDVPE